MQPVRLRPEEIAANFDDIKPPLDRKKALIESSRCYFCHDAPCIEACPTSIDIPNFIRMINTGNTLGAAEKILDANILGGMCARVCPTEILCEDKCVRNTSEDKPVNIGMLQRYAVDHLMEKRAPSVHARRRRRASASPSSAAVRPGFPARTGWRCWATTSRSSMRKAKLGGLNEYGIAAYKTVNDFAQAEVDFLLSIGGISVKTGQALGRDITLDQLRRDFDAVFLGLGLPGVNALGLDGEDQLAGVHGRGRLTSPTCARRRTRRKLKVGRKVVVIGGGNTAIDIAMQTKRLGAEDVTLVYRRAPENMSATWHEQEFAQINGVKIKHWARPVRLIGQNGAVKEVEFERTALDDRGRLIGTGETFSILCDQVFKAIGQKFVKDPVNGKAQESLDLVDGKIAVNEEMKTSLGNVWAGGDCVVSGIDLTVQSVEDGKVAAHAIDRDLRGAK